MNALQYERVYARKRELKATIAEFRSGGEMPLNRKAQLLGVTQREVLKLEAKAGVQHIELKEESSRTIAEKSVTRSVRDDGPSW